MSKNLYALFQSRFPQDMSADFIKSPDGRNLSYQELDQQTAQMAGALIALGTKTGDRIAVQVDKTKEAVVLYLACLRVGAVYLPLNTAYTADELDYFMGDARPHIMVCTPEKHKNLSPVAQKNSVSHLLTLGSKATGSLMDQFQRATPHIEIADVTGDDLAAILYTSGTTGRSKGAMLSHDNLASNATVLHKYWGWVPDDILLHALPIFHVHGLFVAIHCVLMNGSGMWFLPKFDAAEMIALIPKSTVMMGVPTFYTRLLDQPEFDRSTCQNMRLFISGSAPLLEDTFVRFEKLTGMTILERYGMTEAGMITSNPLNGDRIAGTVGYPLPGVEARLSTETSNQDAGVLEIKGPNVFKGYWKMPEKTAEEFTPDGYFITGDIATISADDRVAIVGRAKDLIISGGYNVYPKEIEQVIDAIDGVKESAVIGVQHPDFGEAVVAVIVADNTKNIDQEDVTANLKGQLARFKQPKNIFFTDELPRNTMGKVQKNVLRQDYADLYKEVN
ncbi:malonyl-CoA synthase [Kiloniella litopenaei]|uniref:3-methylmercaptopropionyl-CoA ligase n=1 Tax=Kiloniella litopenaei TaxID=1549748 RepID=A0A0M2RDR3_9PROT|nr:malonyl-CoA synthase [Kiloniella litopenaei]KKJ78594.1 malonyl-CoA synthase [Kiloniella litopenaei]